MQLRQQFGELQQYLVAIDPVVDLVDQIELVDVQVQDRVL